METSEKRDMQQSSVLVSLLFLPLLLLDQILHTPITSLRIHFSHLELTFYFGDREDFKYFSIQNTLLHTGPLYIFYF